MKNLISRRTFIATARLWFVFLFLGLSVFKTSHVSAQTGKVTKILAIGNSFSEDGVENYLYDLAKAEGIKVIIANLYIGGAPLELHVKNIRENKAVYSYRKIGLDGVKKTTPNTSIETALADENWDYISFQQASPLSGNLESVKENLPELFNYVKQRAKNPDVKYIYHQTWAYAKNSEHKGFDNYDRDQNKMYQSIINVSKEVQNIVPINIVVPAGTAIQNGRTSYIGDNFNRDGYHLDLNIGRFTAACTWFEKLFGKPVLNNPFKPETVNTRASQLAKTAAHDAVLNPYQVTELKDFQAKNVQLSNSPVYINFGDAKAYDDWNNLAYFNNGGGIDNLVDKKGNFTGIRLTLVEGFTGKNVSGPKKTSTTIEMPEDVSSSTFYGNSKEEFNKKKVERSVLKISGLDSRKKYTLNYFSSRSAKDVDNRETQFTTDGAKKVIGTVNATNNNSQLVTVKNIRPNANGELIVDITAGSKNTDKHGFYYLNAMSISTGK
ncbi:hypothetical protein Pedsa_0080 [Pseudopedobacter saltans DSM 12145]|uniref:DUF4886 domain-containing protein n=1 Tax=Pseudopedobacter saltans (strain ATCC 51119 / DSM 12145 / JCM 21818 / CCUG 39354 / LMG 10337 / NBRC 100064 / NCIMB 13643) TaxID=762903 RepID=F0SCS9_PSESL|nr:DUF4886 domain-containing protein [Pseudopedobacter saltans]ADY50668.1 hypothetical protein Pedsa_0080 [Pseudopedobacter saltans DSM 12145]